MLPLYNNYIPIGECMALWGDHEPSMYTASCSHLYVDSYVVS